MYIAFVDKVFWPDYCLEIFRILSSKLQREEELRRRVVGAVDKRQCKFSKLQSSRKVSIYYIVVYVHYVIFQERGITEFLRRQKCEKTEIVNDQLGSLLNAVFFQRKLLIIPKFTHLTICTQLFNY